MRTSVTALLFSVLILGGCASSGTSSGSSSNPDLITSEQLREQEGQATNLLEVVQRLRPAWLRARPPTSFRSEQTQAEVFYNGRYYGSLDALRDFRVENLEEVEYIDARDATTRFGTGYTGGVINVMGL